MKSLAIEREFGSGGRQIGRKVAQMLSMPYYDENLLIEAAAKRHIPLGVLQDYDEKRAGSFLYDITLFANYAQQNMTTQSVLEAFTGIQNTIEQLAYTEPSVFVGRCSTDILKDSTNAIRVYIYSTDIDAKLKHICEREKVEIQEARNLMMKKDKQRRNYFRYWTNKDWSDKGNYDITLNLAKLSVDKCVEILSGAIT